MKMVAEYLDKALDFERLAIIENDSKVRADLLKQASAYRRLAAARAKELGLPIPPPQSN
jgi:hypothetical protein